MTIGNVVVPPSELERTLANGLRGARSAGQHTGIDQVLRHGLVAGELFRYAGAEAIAAAVAHVQDVEPGPHRDHGGERRRHAALVAAFAGPGDDGLVAFARRVLQRFQEDLLVVGVGGVEGSASHG